MPRMKSDLYRNFAIGFALGAVIVGMQAGPEFSTDLVPQAKAAVLELAEHDTVSPAS